jgi:hypothetical protein
MHNHNSQRSTKSDSPVDENFQENLTPEVVDESAELAVFAIGYLQSLLSDFYNKMHMFYSLADYTRDCRTLERRITNEGVYFLTSALPVLMNDLLIQLEGGNAVYSGFKLQSGKNYPRFLRRMFDIVKTANYTVLVQAAALDTLYNVSCGF